MEGIGVRFRPQSGVATVVRQSLNELVGSKTILGGSQDKLSTMQILTMLGNIVRIYPHLDATASDLTSSLPGMYGG